MQLSSIQLDSVITASHSVRAQLESIMVAIYGEMMCLLWLTDT